MYYAVLDDYNCVLYDGSSVSDLLSPDASMFTIFRKL